MDTTSKGIGRMAQSVGAAVACLWMVGCASFEKSGLPGSASSLARNQMMMVRQEPPSFGYYRLGSLTQIYPDLGVFMEKRGVPDFLAEADSGHKDYFILYYLKKRQAFACRTHAGRRNAIEFAGPYPVTKREYETLHGFRSKKPD
jgi:hypothetical protein